MKNILKPVTWIRRRLKENKRKNAENDNIQQTIIIDDFPDPEDFKLPPEEYKQRYEERLKIEKQIFSTS